jgi:hypothetical protein
MYPYASSAEVDRTRQPAGEIAPDAKHAPQPGLKPALKHTDKDEDSAASDKG